ncbi:MAG: ParB N-terminal domain-containing protein [Sedimentisphaerales bacterium]|nr:ParB N-terminal domain-containing protein [Sedimentisphaerales bacterium]
MENRLKTRPEKHNIFKTVPIESLIKNPNNPNHMSKPNFKKLVRNIELTGLYEPIIVRHVGWASKEIARNNISYCAIKSSPL